MIKILVRITQVIIVIIPIAVFGWLLWRDLVPTGRLVINYSVGDLSPFIHRILPEERALPPIVMPDGDSGQQIIDEPVYFTVEPPRHFDELELELVWKNEDVPIVELGGLAGEEGSQYYLVPLQNLIIDQSDWYRVENNGIILLQREPEFGTVADFLADLPPRGEIATYHYRLAVPFILDGYYPSSTSQTIDVSLRGFHELKTYIKDETLNYDFAYMDMNRDLGRDEVRILVTADDGTLVAEVRADDDGNSSDNAKASRLKHISVSVPGLEEGVYKIELRVGRDIFWRSIETTQQKTVFLNNIYLADEVGYKENDRPVRFWTEARNMNFQTHHADGAQEVKVAGETVRIPKPYEQYNYTVASDSISEVYSPQGDLIVNTDGHIAFSRDQYFNPDPVRLSWNTDLDQLGVNYIIANYTTPEKEGDWYRSTAIFDTAWLIQEESAWKFTISVPGIDELQSEIWVSDINVVFVREPLTWSKLIQEIKERL